MINQETTDAPAVYDVDPHPEWRAIKQAARNAVERWAMRRSRESDPYAALLDGCDDFERVIFGELLTGYRERMAVAEQEMFGDLSAFRPIGILSALKRDPTEALTLPPRI